MSQINNSSHSSNSIQAAIFADCLTNSKEIFRLIDSVFPVDSCRHYQVLPLELTANDLTLGMLQPDNEESLNFVNSIAKVFKYNLEIKLIDSQTLEIILASYPHTQQPQKLEPDRNKTVIDTSFNPSRDNTRSQKTADSAPTIISQPAPNIPPTPKELPGLPPDLDFLKDLNLASQSSEKPPQPKTDSAATLYEIPPEFLKQKKSDSDNKPTIIADDPARLLARETSQVDPKIAVDEVQRSEIIAEIDKSTKIVAETHSEDFLPRLNPQLSWQNLLEQAFKHRSEQINLTRDRDRGKVIVYQNGSPQSCIEQVPLPIFCSLIDEIKRMARLRQNTIHPKKVVIERFHQQERILLRIEFVFQEPEEANSPSDCINFVKIQILRDRSLQTYEQQQMDKTSEQALQLAKQLEKALKKIQTCFHSGQITNLKELQAVQSRINHHLRLLDK